MQQKQELMVALRTDDRGFEKSLLAQPHISGGGTDFVHGLEPDGGIPDNSPRGSFWSDLELRLHENDDLKRSRQAGNEELARNLVKPIGLLGRAKLFFRRHSP